jgi:hypothetical protein
VPSPEERLNRIGAQELRDKSIPFASARLNSETSKKSEGEIASEAFNLLPQRKTPIDLVVQLKIPPDAAKALSDKYAEYADTKILSRHEQNEINRLLPMADPVFYDIASLKSLINKISGERQNYKARAEAAEPKVVELEKLSKQWTTDFTFTCSVCGDPMPLTREIWPSIKDLFGHPQCIRSKSHL